MSSWRRFSRLPQSDEYWQRLIHRVQQSAHAASNMPDERVRSLAPFAWTAVAAAAAAVIATAYFPAPSRGGRSGPLLLAPADPTGAAWVERTQPPDAAELLLTRLEQSR